jgi:hypothetical protein
MAQESTRPTSRASLWAVGASLTRHWCFAPLRAQGQSPQKTVRSRPLDKRRAGLCGSRCGAQTMAQSQGTSRLEPAVPRACGRTGWAEQSPLARTWQASTAEPVRHLARGSWADLKRSGHTPQQRCAARRLGVAVDGPPRPIGPQAAGSARPWMGRTRSQTGRKTVRCTARDSREMLHATVLRGKASAGPALQTAWGALETRRGGRRQRRQRLGRRLEGGCGTTEGLTGRLRRASQGVATLSHRGRVRKVRQPMGAGPPPARPGRASAAGLRPHRVCRATSPWVLRTPTEQGGEQDAVVVTTVSEPEPVARAEADAGRALSEATFCQDQQAWGRVTRRQRQGDAQPLVLLVARVAPHRLLGGQQGRRRVPTTRRRWRGYGLGRWRREGWAVPGGSRWRRGWRVSGRCSPLHPLATPLQESFSALVRGRVRVGCLR